MFRPYRDILRTCDVLTTVVRLSLVFMLIQHIDPLVPRWPQSIIAEVPCHIAEAWAACGSTHAQPPTA